MTRNDGVVRESDAHPGAVISFTGRLHCAPVPGVTEGVEEANGKTR